MATLSVSTRHLRLSLVVLSLLVATIGAFPSPLARQNRRDTPLSIPRYAVSRREVLAAPAVLATSCLPSLGPWNVVKDPDSYTAFSYSPPSMQKPPLILFLHGAGKNELDILNLADINGEHAGLLPSLIANNQAPKDVTDKFAILAPYSYQKRSLYDEPRSKVLKFVDWAASPAGRDAGCPDFDPNRIYLFGFSDGATLAVELMTTGRFRGAVVAAYGFAGILPELALQRLQNQPMWIFHSADDVIFPVECSDKLVESLKRVNTQDDVVRYTRFDKDPEGFTGAVQGHSTGITASKDPRLYKWLLSIE